MSEEKIYKYAILRNRDGEYVIPYSGVHGLADVAFTGSYKDLKDAPSEENTYLPAAIDKTGSEVKYRVNNDTIFDEDVLLDYEIEYLTGPANNKDFVRDVNAVNTQFVYDVAHYLVDKLKDEIDRAIQAAEEEGGEQPPEEPYSDIPRVFQGTVPNRAALGADNIISNVQDGYYWLVEDEQIYLMYVTAAEGNWVEIHP